MEAVNERSGHRLLAEHGTIPRLVRGGCRGRPQRALSSWKARPPPADRQVADLNDQLRRVGERAISPARVPQWTRQPFPAAATGQSPRKGRPGPRSPNLLRQETLEADGELAFMPQRAPPQRA